MLKSSLILYISCIIVVFSFPSIDSYNCCDYGVFDYFCPHCYGHCVVRDRPGIKLRELMEQKLFGQDHIIDPFVDMIDRWYARVIQGSMPGAPTDKRKLTAFHIAGENGVGKSFATTLLAQTLYQYNDEGFILISGTNFEGNERSVVERHKETLFNLIAQQLEKCSKSLIIIDEVQYIHATTLRVLQQFMEPSNDYVVRPDGRKVYKSDAIIGLVSDFGREGRTKGMTLEELQQLVLQHTRELWDADTKQSQLIDYIFPFVALTDDDIERMMRYLITEVLPGERFHTNLVKTIQVSESSIRFMRYKVRKLYPNENGRGADKFIEGKLIPMIYKAIQDKSAQTGKTRVSWNVDIRYKNNDVEVNLIEAR